MTTQQKPYTKTAFITSHSLELLGKQANDCIHRNEIEGYSVNKAEYVPSNEKDLFALFILFQMR